MTTTTLTHLTFDCADAEKLATFWSAVLDLPMGDDPSSDYAVLTGTPSWMFLSVQTTRCSPPERQQSTRRHASAEAPTRRAPRSLPPRRRELVQPAP